MNKKEFKKMIHYVEINYFQFKQMYIPYRVYHVKKTKQMIAK